MTLEHEIEHSLRKELPTALHDRVPRLAQVLAEAFTGTLTDETVRQQLKDVDLEPLLRALAGQQVRTKHTLLSFGQGSEMGAVDIGDVAGGNMTKLSLPGHRAVRVGNDVTKSPITTGDNNSVANAGDIRDVSGRVVIGGNMINIVSDLSVETEPLFVDPDSLPDIYQLVQDYRQSYPLEDQEVVLRQVDDAQWIGAKLGVINQAPRPKQIRDVLITKFQADYVIRFVMEVMIEEICNIEIIAEGDLTDSETAASFRFATTMAANSTYEKSTKQQPDNTHIQAIQLQWDFNTAKKLVGRDQSTTYHAIEDDDNHNDVDDNDNHNTVSHSVITGQGILKYKQTIVLHQSHLQATSPDSVPMEGYDILWSSQRRTNPFRRLPLDVRVVLESEW
jgi:hypothetical protein